jgi:hypothetical protein
MPLEAPVMTTVASRRLSMIPGSSLRLSVDAPLATLGGITHWSTASKAPILGIVTGISLRDHKRS